jgi:selenocysteine-specific elongation factor
MRFATQQQFLIDLGQGFHISSQVFRMLCQELQSLFAVEAELSVATIRDRWLVTRKHAIPLLEYCDRAAITVRHDTLRTAGRELAKYCTEERTTKYAAE